MSRRVSSVLYTLWIVVGTGGLEWPEFFQSLDLRLGVTTSRYGHVEVQSPGVVLAIAATELGCEEGYLYSYRSTHSPVSDRVYRGN